MKPVSHSTDHVSVGLASPHSPTSKENRSRWRLELQPVCAGGALQGRYLIFKGNLICRSGHVGLGWHVSGVHQDFDQPAPARETPVSAGPSCDSPTGWQRLFQFREAPSRSPNVLEQNSMQYCYHFMFQVYFEEYKVFRHCCKRKDRGEALRK